MKERIKSILSKYDLGGLDLDRVAEEIENAILGGKKGGDNLVIVANQGVHPIDEAKLPGEVFYASQGNLGGSPMNPDALKADLEGALTSTAKKLKERHWRKVYIVPTGLPVLSIQLSAIVHQVTAKPAIPLQFDRESGEYWPMDADIRHLATTTE